MQQVSVKIFLWLQRFTIDATCYRFRIQDNLHVVLTMPPDLFSVVYRPYSNLFLKSGCIRMTEWTEELLISIAADRYIYKAPAWL